MTFVTAKGKGMHARQNAENEKVGTIPDQRHAPRLESTVNVDNTRYFSDTAIYTTDRSFALSQDSP